MAEPLTPEQEAQLRLVAAAWRKEPTSVVDSGYAGLAIARLLATLDAERKRAREHAHELVQANIDMTNALAVASQGDERLRDKVSLVVGDMSGWLVNSTADIPYHLADSWFRQLSFALRAALAAEEERG